MELPKILKTIETINNSRESVASKTSEHFAEYLIKTANDRLSRYLELTESLYVNDFPNQDAVYIIGKIKECHFDISGIHGEIGKILSPHLRHLR